MTREEWVEEFLHHFTDPSRAREIPTTYRDGGAAVRFLFATGAEVEFHWQDQPATVAASEAIAAEVVV